MAFTENIICVLKSRAEALFRHLFYMFRKKSRILCAEIRKMSIVKSNANFFHKGIVKIQIVHDCKPACKLFSRLEKVTDVGSGKITAGGTVALSVNRQRVCFVTLICDVHNAAPGENSSVTSVPAGHYTVEQVDTPCYCFNDV